MTYFDFTVWKERKKNAEDDFSVNPNRFILDIHIPVYNFDDICVLINLHTFKSRTLSKFSNFDDQL